MTATCDLAGCHAPTSGRGRRYCCPEHAAAGRNIANARARAAAAERRVLQDALNGKAVPPEHVGFLGTTAGVVLTGQAVLELRAAASALRSAAQKADQRQTSGLNQAMYLGRLRDVRQTAEQAAAAVERLLP